MPEYKSLEETLVTQDSTEYECQECFAVVFNREAHSEWHNGQLRNRHGHVAGGKVFH